MRVRTETADFTRGRRKPLVRRGDGDCSLRRVVWRVSHHVGPGTRERKGRRLRATFIACMTVWFTAMGCGQERNPISPEDSASVPAMPERREMDAAVPLADSGTGAQATAVADAWVPDVPACNGELPVMKTRDLYTNIESDPDWSCYDASDGEDAGVLQAATQNATFRFVGWEKSVIEGITVDFHWGPTTLGVPAASRTFEPDAGEVTFPIPAGQRRVSVHTHALHRADSRYDISELRDYDVPVPDDGGPLLGFIQLRDRRALAALVFASDEVYDPDKALLVALALDCAGEDVGGVQVELVEAETGAVVKDVVEQGQPRSAYLRYALPDPSCTFTNNGTNQAAWMMINAPINVSGDRTTRQYKVRLKGRMYQEQTQPVVFAERVVELSAATTTAVRAYLPAR